MPAASSGTEEPLVNVSLDSCQCQGWIFSLSSGCGILLGLRFLLGRLTVLVIGFLRIQIASNTYHTIRIIEKFEWTLFQLLYPSCPLFPVVKKVQRQEKSSFSWQEARLGGEGGLEYSKVLSILGYFPLFLLPQKEYIRI